MHANEDGRRRGINPFEHGESYTTIMRTDPLKEALDQHRFDVIFGGARRDEEKARAKERIVSVRDAKHGWDPRRQRPELWRLFNWEIDRGESIRAFPLSNWTEADLWIYIVARGVALAPLSAAAERPVVERDGTLLVVDDPERMPWQPGEVARPESVRFRTLGCWPVTGAVRSNAVHPLDIMRETLAAPSSERMGRTGDAGSLESQKRAGYF